MHVDTSLASQTLPELVVSSGLSNVYNFLPAKRQETGPNVVSKWPV